MEYSKKSRDRYIRFRLLIDPIWTKINPKAQSIIRKIVYRILDLRGFEKLRKWMTNYYGYYCWYNTILTWITIRKERKIPLAVLSKLLHLESGNQ